MRLAAGLVFSAMTLAAGAQSDLPPDVLLLSRVRHHTVADLEKIPNFTCLETIERSMRNSPLKSFGVNDVVRVEVAHVGGQDLFTWPGASNFETRPLADMVGTGMISNGEFISHARAIFEGSAIIHYVDEEDFGGHRASRFDYEISAAFSGYMVNVNGRSGVVGSRGSFWADTTTFDLLRLTVEGSDIPDQLGVRALLSDIEYGRLHIGSGDYLLPQSSRVWMGLDSGLEKRNRIDFTHCRQYGTESVVSFAEVPDAAKPSSAPPAEFTLPAGLALFLRLETAIRISSAKVGDAVSATLTSDLKYKGQLLAPKGSTVSGRVRLLQKDDDRYIAGLEFTDLAFDNNRARFVARLVSSDSRYAQTRASSTRSNRSVNGNIDSRSMEIEETPPDLPGVATFFIPAGVVQLPKGMLMEWKTVGLGK